MTDDRILIDTSRTTPQPRPERDGDRVPSVVISVNQDFTVDEKECGRNNIDAASTESLTDHIDNTSNPHNVTAEQVGAYTKEQVDAEIKKESDAREFYDSQLRESIEALEEKTGDFVTGEEVSAAVSAEADARIQEDIALNARIDTIPQTDWDEEDEGSMAYLQNHPTPISDLDIEALFT